jgi:ribosomal protein S12 methylthiotransferase accessory factor
MLRFAYNTNGLSHHRLDDALAFVADTGYDGVALTLDTNHLDPYAPDLEGRTAALRERLDALGLGTVIETGARYLLDPRAKHEPTLVSADPARRIDFLRRCVDVAAALDSECVSFWSGIGPPERWGQLVDGVGQVLAYARERGVVAALEPEPGMLVEDLDDLARLRGELPALPLALDVGHLLVTQEREPVAAIHEHAGLLATVTVEDMARGEHVHRMFGEGDLDLPPVLAALEVIGWRGLVCVELSRDAHRAHEVVPAALSALQAAAPSTPAGPAPAR